MKQNWQASRHAGISPQFSCAGAHGPRRIKAVSEAIIALRHGFDKLGAAQLAAPETATQRAACCATGTSAPSFMGSCGTSLRQAPRATAAITAAKTIALFIFGPPLAPEVFRNSGLPSYLRRSRNITRAELQRLMRNFATAGSHSHSRDDRCENDRALHNLHVFSPDAYSAIAFNGLPASSA
jgi:hypothetical protein